jgi:hypothetical protein
MVFSIEDIETMPNRNDYKKTAKTVFVETLIDTINRSWGLQPIVLPPPPLGHPPYCDNP